MASRKTSVSIVGDMFYINGKPTYAGRSYNGLKIEGLLFNSRMVQALFDDENPETRPHWAYPDTGTWDPERNVREFLEAMPLWRKHGLLAITINMQGGNPRGYQRQQPWRNSGFDPQGEIKPAYADRLRRVLDRADELGMVVILGVLYFGQDEYLADEAAVKRAVENTVRWVLERGYTNVILEVNNECDVRRYEHEILQPHRVHELIQFAKEISVDGRGLLVATSWGGGSIPRDQVVAVSDFILLHGNGVKDPERIAEMVDRTRALPSYTPMPILFNEDDHFDFDKPVNNMMKAVERYASWGYFDPGENNYRDGYQSPPVFWGINTPRKESFFRKVAEVTGSRV